MPRLTRCSYDGETDDPAPAPAPAVLEEPVKSETEAVSASAEPQESSWESGPAHDDIQLDTELEQGDGQNMIAEPQDHGNDYDRPIGIKEDGYV